MKAHIVAAPLQAAQLVFIVLCNQCIVLGGCCHFDAFCLHFNNKALKNACMHACMFFIGVDVWMNSNDKTAGMRRWVYCTREGRGNGFAAVSAVAVHVLFARAIT